MAGSDAIRSNSTHDDHVNRPPPCTSSDQAVGTNRSARSRGPGELRCHPQHRVEVRNDPTTIALVRLGRHDSDKGNDPSPARRHGSVGLIVLARDEESSIGRCLTSVAKDVQQSVVLDMQSEDRTAAIAGSLGATVISVPIRRQYDGLRQIAVDALETDWVLQLDADEWAPGVLPLVAAQGHLDGDRPIAFPKINHIGDRWLRRNHWWPNYQVRMFRRGHGHYTDTFHDHLQAEGKPIRLPARPEFGIHHEGHIDGADLLRSVARFVPPPTPLRARDGVGVLVRPLASYLLSRGWRDGTDGVVVLAGKIVNSVAKSVGSFDDPLD